VAPVTAAAAPWYTGKVDAETLGSWQNHGWADKSPEDIAIAATKAHREAEKFIGAPANELARLPKADADAATLQAFWGRLGAPDTKDGYDLSGVKFADGTELDAAFVDTLRTAAASLHLPKDAAAGVAQAMVKFLDTQEMTEAAERTAALAAEKQALDKNWGPNKDANLMMARNAANALKIDQKALDALESVVGYAKVMEMFRDIGSKIGEDKYFTGGNSNSNGVMTQEQAIATKADLMKDSAWVGRYMGGGSAENKQMQALLAIIVGDDTAYSRNQ
jgi:hypothetical protein